MRWIVGADDEIVVDNDQLRARRDYIQLVTGAEVSEWDLRRINGPTPKEFYFCVSNDGVDGVFITAHKDDVNRLCSLPEIRSAKMVVANSCILNDKSDIGLLKNMRRSNKGIELYFAKQDLSMDITRSFRQTTTLDNIGEFGFQTSASERQLFSNRRRGLRTAIKESFVQVSSIILI